ncbi:BatD family protein [Vibrio variabilis]|uniref:BatD family protein n=1 Tax=Vibrio variabilis TaxID=990271 RepID=UPI000DD855B5|nr:BatD family protein [Vibrio variabilis]
MRLFSKPALLCSVLFLATMGVAHAALGQQERLIALSKQERVIVNASLAGTSTIVPNQQVIVNIEVMTDTWFTQGTRVHRFDVNNALVLQRSSFAINSIERIDGRKYAKQLWEVVIYPLEPGRYFVPSIVIELAVSDEQNTIAGQLSTESFEFTVDSLTDHHQGMNTVVGENPSIKQLWTHTSAGGTTKQIQDIGTLDVQVGDAIERQITVSIQDSTSVLIPKPLINIKQSGLKSYHESPLFMDSENRGVYSASRTDKVTYIVDAGGRVELPNYQLQVWSPRDRVIKNVAANGITLNIEHTPFTFAQAYWKAILIGLTMCGLTLLTVARGVKKYQLLEEQKSLPIGWMFLLSVMKQDNAQAETMLYLKKQVQRQQFALSHGNKVSQQFIEQWQVSKYGNQTEVKSKTTRITWLRLWFNL